MCEKSNLLQGLKERLDEKLSIFWKSAYMKSQDFLKWITEKNFFYTQRSAFFIFVKIWFPTSKF